MRKTLASLIISAVLLCNMGSYTGSAAILTPQLSPRTENIALASSKKGGSLPEYYSSADLGYVSGPDNQLTTAVCWAFVHNELIETYVAKTTGKKVDLSEQTMKFETSEDTNEKYGFGRAVNEGGNEYISTAYLARGGVTFEKDEPFSVSETRLVLPELMEYTGVLQSVPMASFGEYYQPEGIEQIKKLVYKYGAVGSAVYFDKGSSYQNEQRTNYYYNGEMATPDHEVTIVGWDDNYSKDNFVVKPEGDGAFIVKNSWGNYHNDQTSDLVYISYYDKFINKDVFATSFDMQNNVYDNIYQYDHFGWSSNGNYSGNTMIYATKYNRKTPGEKLSGVSTYVTHPGVTLEVYVSVNGEDFKNIKSYKKVHKETFEYSGYYFMDFEDVKITGSEFTVAIKVTSPKSMESVYFPLQTNSGGIIRNSKLIPETCYISGTNFRELTAIENYSQFSIPEAMLAMKAFTVNTDIKIEDSSKKFKDVDKKSWYKEYVDFAVTYGMFQGTGKETFSPEMSVSRAQFVQVLANLSAERITETDDRFYDVKETDWFAAAVKWAKDREIVSGTAWGEFSPHLPVTREQMCVMLAGYTENYLGKKMQKTDFVFKDGKDISSWAKKDVYKCYASGIISGVGGGKFLPQATATRDQGATVFAQFYKNLVLE